MGLCSPAALAQGGPAAGSQIVTVQASSIGSSVALGGTVVAYREVTLTAQIPGRVEFLAGTEGDRFKADDILVAIDDDDLLAQRRSALAQLSNAQSAISNAQVQYQRELWSPQSRSISRSGGMGMPNMFDQMFTQPFAQSFMPGNVGGDRWVDRQADIHGFGTQLTQAHNQALAAQSQIEEIDAKLRDTRSFAPFDGVITRKMVEEGDTVQPGQPLLEFADLTYLQVEVDVPVRLMPGLKKGMLIPARLDVGNVRVDVRVAQIFPSADPVRHTVTVKFDLPMNVPGGPGMYAEVMVPDISTGVSSVPVIPDSAVLWRGSLPAVYVATDDDKAELRLIRLGDYVGSREVAVLSGLQIGERIYVSPPGGAAPGWSHRGEK
ncbi:MAG: efflux RND transporter periplasmic adaptor subunit [Gammaproteobacteria bacterium]|nr:MAG: efflux RND transporter periplasmic adaptor subunit [Gammaproteobacteria bacterium]